MDKTKIPFYTDKKVINFVSSIGKSSGDKAFLIHNQVEYNYNQVVEEMKNGSYLGRELYGRLVDFYDQMHSKNNSMLKGLVLKVNKLMRRKGDLK